MARPQVRRPSLAVPAVPYATHQEPLEDRIDAAGIRQREDPEGAKALRAKAFERDQEDAAGCWKHDGQGGWAYHGDGEVPT